MSDEPKKPKVALIKQKKIAAPPPSAASEIAAKEDTEKKKIVVIKKKVVVVRKSPTKRPDKAPEGPVAAQGPQGPQGLGPVGRQAAPVEEPKAAETPPVVERVRLQEMPLRRVPPPRPAGDYGDRGRPAGRYYRPGGPPPPRPPAGRFDPRRGPGRPDQYSGPPRRPGGFGGPPRPKPATTPSTEAKKPAAGKKFIRKGKKGGGFSREKFEEHQEKIFGQKKKTSQRANPVPKEIAIMETITVSELARKMNLKASQLISKLMSMGMMVTMNQPIDSETASILAGEYECKVNVVSLYDETIIAKEEDRDEDLTHRPPIVTVMGHVDHGKTKLLDAIRTTNVVDSEFGGITQHIGAYAVDLPQGRIVFLDTPGHEAFTTMRARGAQVTDLVVLVVAADDGVMPQTIEAISHAKEAKVPIIVALNKIDLPEANPERVKQQLAEHDLVPEAWGGHTLFCELSALKRTGIQELLDAILLQADLLELKANHDCRAEGRIVESKIDFGRGIVATVLVRRGTLKVGDPFVAGVFSGKVRAMYDDKGDKVDAATPSIPIEIVGFSGIPNAGDPFQVTESEKEARQIGAKRQELKKLEEAGNVSKITLDTFYDRIKEGEVQELKVIIKADVHGSVEALQQSLERLSTSEIRLEVIHAYAGTINETDVRLAAASDAIIIGFNVRPTSATQALADHEKVEIRKYNIIYDVVNDVKSAMEGLLKPEYAEEVLGTAEVRNLFKVPKIGIVAGSYVTSGKVRRNAFVRVLREGKVIYTGKISSLRRFKDDAREVEENYECGIGVENFNDLKIGDIIEAFETVEKAKTLERVTADVGSKTEKS